MRCGEDEKDEDENVLHFHLFFKTFGGCVLGP